MTAGHYASVRGLDPYPDSDRHHFGDPSGDPLATPMASAAVDVLTRKLNWRPDGSYELLNGAVAQAGNSATAAPRNHCRRSARSLRRTRR